MSSQRVRVRFAPSPTGALHLGSARTALFNWLFARHHGGDFVLRIEDTDAARSTEKSAEGIVEGLRWLGIEWDEGPGVGGEKGPYFQSERRAIYREYAQRLVEKGLAYPCYCTAEEVNARREALRAQGKDPKYDRKCLHLTEEEKRRLEAEGRQAVLRFYSSDEGVTVVNDLVRGEMQFQNALLDDFVIMRADGNPTYNFAVVVDDHEMAITHVIRGEDHISNTPRQVQVYEALGISPPAFAHLPMIYGQDRAKLSKRHGARFIMEYAEEGYLPEALVNYLALLGWAYDDSQEVFEIPRELVEKFELGKVSKNPAVFDPQKLEWMNGVHIRKLTPEALADRALPFMRRAGLLPDRLDEELRRRYVGVVEQVQIRLKTLSEIVGWTRCFFTDEIEYDESAVKKWLEREYVPELLSALLERLISLQPFDVAGIERVFDEMVERFGLKRGDLMQPVRVAVTGGTVSPGMYETLALLGRAKTCERLRAALKRLRKS